MSSIKTENKPPQRVKKEYTLGFNVITFSINVSKFQYIALKILLRSYEKKNKHQNKTQETTPKKLFLLHFFCLF